MLSLSRVVFITKESPHPNAAKLFLDYVLSKRGQQLIADKGNLIAIRKDVDGKATFSAVSQEVGDRLAPVALDPSLLDGLDPATASQADSAMEGGRSGLT